jgi:hypothetical protein
MRHPATVRSQVGRAGIEEIARLDSGGAVDLREGAFRSLNAQ